MASDDQRVYISGRLGTMLVAMDAYCAYIEVLVLYPDTGWTVVGTCVSCRDSHVKLRPATPADASLPLVSDIDSVPPTDEVEPALAA